MEDNERTGLDRQANNDRRTPTKINREVLATANDFYQGALILNEHGSGEGPTIVNAVLACELFLKSFNSEVEEKRSLANGAYTYTRVSSKPNYMVHGIVGLFDELDASVKETLMQKFFEKTNNNLKVLLTQINRAFIEWRYPYEHKHRPINLLELFYFLSILDATTMKMYNNQYKD